jgi:hypothetical protein
VAPPLVRFPSVMQFAPPRAVRARSSFPLRWNGVGGDESLRGLAEWDGAGDGNVQATLVVRLTPDAAR